MDHVRVVLVITTASFTTLEHPSRISAWCGRLPAASLLIELDVFFTDHRDCGDLEVVV